MALPVLPDIPTAAQAGQVLYYYHCMPCHGDRGQGLTDEWRQVWVEDHQNCWGRGCHAGRLGDEGFPLPRVIPGVIGGAQGLNEFSRATDLEAYLRLTHPPQRPGGLADEDYRDLTAYLWEANSRQPPQVEAPSASGLTGPTLAILGGLLLAAWGAASRPRRRGENPGRETRRTGASV